MRSRLRVDPGLVFAVLLALLMCAPLLEDRYFFKAHDAPHSVFYLVEFDQSFRDGAWWPRWGKDYALGYGYPLYSVYSPLSFFVGEAFVLLGLGFVGAVKATYVTAILASAAGMYLFVRRLLGPAAGVVASAAYTFIPYHVLDVYVRSAYAEFFAFVWMPFVLWAFLRLEPTKPDAADPAARLISEGVPLSRLGFAGISLAGIVLTHNASAMLFVPFFLIFLLWRLIDHRFQGTSWLELGRVVLRWTAGGVLALGLGAIFWYPMVMELRYVRPDDWLPPGYDFQDHFVLLHQLFSPYWGFGYSTPLPDDTMGLQLGLAAVLLGGFALAGSPLSIPSSARRVAWFFAIMTALVAALMLPIATPVWQRLPGAALVQFPWRLLLLTTLTLAPLAGAAVAGIESRFALPLAGRQAAIPLAMLIFLTSFSTLRVEPTPIKAADIQPRAIIDFELFSPNIRIGAVAASDQKPTNSPLVEYYQRNERPLKWQLEDPNGRIEVTHYGGESDEARVRAPRGGRLTYLTYNFPGWRIRVDNVPVEHYNVPPYGLIGIDLPPGDHVVSARFETTPPRQLGTAASAVSLLAVAWLTVGSRIRWRRKAEPEE